MRRAARDWIERGQPYPDMLGSFFHAVLLNDLCESFCCADEENAAHMREWAFWLYNDCPTLARGDREKLLAWHARGGLGVAK